jgi:L-malate glycosyltransferase
VTITFVLPFVNLTGGIRVLIDYANDLHDRGHRVAVVYPMWPYRYHHTLVDQLRELRKQWSIEPAIGWTDLRCRLARVPFIANRFLPDADVVIATSWPTAFTVARLHPSKGQKVHTVFHHESETGPEDRIRQVYSLPFRRIAFSGLIRDALRNDFCCTIHDVVPNGVDASRFFPDGDRADDVVLMLYHNEPRKGAADGIEALAIVRQRFPNVRFRLCGTVRPDRPPSWISFYFHPCDAELRRLYSTSTVLLYPSRYEGFGLPPLEAMACGCPVVTTAVGAVSEYAAHRRNAIVVQPGDVNGLAAGVEALLLDAHLRARLREEGLETARRFALATVAPLFGEALLRSVDTQQTADLQTSRSPTIGSTRPAARLPGRPSPRIPPDRPASRR